MITRRSLTLLALALMLVVPAAAQADKVPPKSVKGPKIYVTLTDGAMNRTISPTIVTTFAPPKGTTAAAACKGKITASVPIGKKTVKKKKKTIYKSKKSSIKNVAGICTASSVLKISEAFYGKTLKFTSTFKGNDAVKKFSKSTKFALIVPPPPPPAFDPTKGPWNILQKPNGSAVQQWTFTVGPDGTIAKIDRLTTLMVACPGTSEPAILTPSSAAFDTPFKINATDIIATDTASDVDTHSESVFNLHFDSPGHATGTFRLTGTLRAATGILVSTQPFPNCDSGLIDVELKTGTVA